MLVDSHCHLNFLDLVDFNNDISEVLAQANEQGVHRFLCVCVELSDYPKLKELAETYPNIYISVGVHPNSEMVDPVTSKLLCNLASHKSCIALGETGLDYYRTTTEPAQELQRHRFSQHIKAALFTSKPLIIHTRQAAEDTLRVMEMENADAIGGVMHCFSEDLTIARRALDLNFYISFSGILTFKNAITLQEVARKIPLDKILIETDAPYLAPVPFRGKQNHPALIRYVAQALADIRGISYQEVVEATTENFYNCFKVNIS